MELKLGDWVLVYFPKDEVGRNRKLSRPWHGPYRIIEKRDPDITLCKVYFPEEKSIQVHQTRIQPCPMNFPAGYYWYGSRRVGPGRPPKWVDRLMATDRLTVNPGNDDEDDGQEEEQESEPPVETSNVIVTSPNDQNSGTKMKKTRTRTVMPPVRYQS